MGVVKYDTFINPAHDIGRGISLPEGILSGIIRTRFLHDLLKFVIIQQKEYRTINYAKCRNVAVFGTYKKYTIIAKNS